jgi:hypothetical protein
MEQLQGTDTMSEKFKKAGNAVAADNTEVTFS